MRVVDLGHGAVALEPDSAAGDGVGSLDVSRLRHTGVREDAIGVYLRYYGDGPSPAASDAGPDARWPPGDEGRKQSST